MLHISLTKQALSFSSLPYPLTALFHSTLDFWVFKIYVIETLNLSSSLYINYHLYKAMVDQNKIQFSVGVTEQTQSKDLKVTIN